MSKFLDALTDFSYASSQRGLDYFKKGKISKCTFDNYECRGKVKGSYNNEYHTILKFNRKYELLSNTCTCPVGYYCKHAAALLYLLDDKAEKGVIDAGPNEVDANDWKEEINRLFNRYFTSRRYYSPEYGLLLTFLEENKEKIGNEFYDAILLIINKVLEYYYNFRYAAQDIYTFFFNLSSKFLTKESYVRLLNDVEKEKKHLFLFFINLFLSIPGYEKETNDFLYEYLQKQDIKPISFNKEMIDCNKLQLTTFLYIIEHYPFLISHQSLEASYNIYKKKALDSYEEVYQYYLIILALINYDHYFDLSEEALNKLKKFNIEWYREILFKMHMSRGYYKYFLKLLLSYPNHRLDKDKEEILKAKRGKSFYEALYLHQPMTIIESDLYEVSQFLVIDHFFDGYEEWLKDLSLNTCKRVKKLKSYDAELLASLKILSFYHDPNITSLLLDEAVKEKMSDGMYYYEYLSLLYRNNLLTSLGFKKYGTIS